MTKDPAKAKLFESLIGNSADISKKLNDPHLVSSKTTVQDELSKLTEEMAEDLEEVKKAKKILFESLQKYKLLLPQDWPKEASKAPTVTSTSTKPSTSSTSQQPASGKGLPPQQGLPKPVQIAAASVSSSRLDEVQSAQKNLAELEKIAEESLKKGGGMSLVDFMRNVLPPFEQSMETLLSKAEQGDIRAKATLVRIYVKGVPLVQNRIGMELGKIGDRQRNTGLPDDEIRTEFKNEFFKKVDPMPSQDLLKAGFSHDDLVLIVDHLIKQAEESLLNLTTYTSKTETEENFLKELSLLYDKTKKAIELLEGLSVKTPEDKKKLDTLKANLIKIDTQKINSRDNLDLRRTHLRQLSHIKVGDI